MNNGRIWCVVNPTVGLPLFLGSVALISFTVHFAVLNNTGWVADYWKGKSRTAPRADTATIPPVALRADGNTTFVLNVAPAGTGDAVKQIVVTVTPQGAASVVDSPQIIPSAAEAPPGVVDSPPGRLAFASSD
jgi:light-harvesting protein B-800-850 alpha chain